MTRVVGCHIHHCPQCHAAYAASAYASINLMEFRTWSDGYSSYALYAVPPRVLRCSTCGFVGLRERFTSNETTPDRDESLPRLHDLAIAPTQLPTLIASHAWGADTDLALALYQQCWMEANHPYRERLLQHRRQAMRDDGFLPRVPVCDESESERWFSKGFHSVAPGLQVSA